MDEQESDVGMGHRTFEGSVRRVRATLDHAQAALAAARGAGLAVERAEVARVASNVLVRIEPGPVAARLTGATEGFRDSAANLRREARLAAALAAAGAPVPAPLGGPYEAGGRVVTLWPWLELRGVAGDAEQAGRALRACHDALADLDPAGLELEPLAMLTEARRLAAGSLPEILPAVDRALAALGAVPHRIVHGDSHPGNVLWTAGGPLWSDWEDAHLAPLEWDLACLVTAGRVHGNDFGWAEASLAAHGAAFDATLLDACVDARVAQGAAYLAATGRGDPGGHLAWLDASAS
jgi:aminoglycoside phosphotransferase (APT) family kinase protein